MKEPLNKTAWLEAFAKPFQGNNHLWLRKLLEREAKKKLNYDIIGLDKRGPDVVPNTGGEPEGSTSPPSKEGVAASVPEQGREVAGSQGESGIGSKVLISPHGRVDYIRTIQRGV